MRWAILILVSLAFNAVPWGAQAGAPLCDGHARNTDWELRSEPGIVVNLFGKAGDNPEITINAARTAAVNFLGCVCACSADKVSFIVTAKDKDDHMCQGVVTGQVSNFILPSDALGVKITGTGITNTVSLVSTQAVDVAERTWTGSWAVPTDAAGQMLDFQFGGIVSDKYCAAHPASKDTDVSLDGYKGQFAVLSVDITKPNEDEVFLKGEELKFESSVEPPGLSGVTYAWSVTEGTCGPSTGTIADFETTLKSEGAIKVKLEVTVGGTTCEKVRTIEAVLPEVTKISWIDDHDIYDHVSNAKIDDPVWTKTLGGAVTKNESGAYTKSGNAKAELEIEGSKALTYGTSVQVQGDGVAANDENFTPQGATLHNWTWSSGELQLLSSPLYASVNFYDTLEVKWQYRVQTLSGGWGDWVDMNESSQLLYTLLANPSGGVTVYEKLLDFSCHWAANETTANGTFSKIWDKIDDRNATGYKYWGPDALGVVATRDLLLKEDGQCGAWGDFFKDIHAVHGITVAKIGVTPKAVHGAAFLVQNAVFQEPPIFQRSFLTTIQAR